MTCSTSGSMAWKLHMSSVQSQPSVLLRRLATYELQRIPGKLSETASKLGILKYPANADGHNQQEDRPDLSRIPVCAARVSVLLT